MRFSATKRPLRGPARFLFLVWIATSAAGCHWFRYYDLLDTHVEIMQGMAADTAAAVRAGVFDARASELERLGYPLLRAQQFEAISKDWDGTSVSGAAFSRFLAIYSAFVEVVDRSRVDGVDARERREIVESVARVRAGAEAVRICVVCEREEQVRACRRCRGAEGD